MLLLPERRRRLEAIHDERACFEGGGAVRACNADKNNRLSGQQPAVAVDDCAGENRPASFGLVCDGVKLALCHAWIMFKCEGNQPVVGADETGEAGNGAHIDTTGAERNKLGRGVEQRGLDADTHRPNHR